MTELLEDSTESDKSTIAHASDLLTHYSFDLGNHTVTQLLDHWLQEYPAHWVRLAVIEALYQGRYKAVSVRQILQFWQRRTEPVHRFSYEFERLVCNKFPRNLNQPDPVPPNGSSSPAVLPSLPPLAPTDQPYLPAWTALATQIQQKPSALVAKPIAAPIAPIPHPPESLPALPPLNTAAQLINPAVPLEIGFPKRLGVQANVTALIEQASLNLNASAEAMKTKLRPEEATPELTPELTAPLTLEPGPSRSIAPEPSPPPSADFHAKLKAVAEQHGEGQPEPK
jgi:hypothetical protein